MNRSHALWNVWNGAAAVCGLFAALFFSSGHILLAVITTGLAISVVLIGVHFELSEHFGNKYRFLAPAAGIVCWAILFFIYPSTQPTSQPRQQTVQSRDSTAHAGKSTSDTLSSARPLASPRKKNPESVSRQHVSPTELRKAIESAAELNDPVNEARILVVFQHSVKSDSLVNFDAGFELSSASGHLYVRTRVFNPTDTARKPPMRWLGPGRLAYKWYTGVSECTDDTLPRHWFNTLRNLQSDTLTFKILLEHVHELPFRVIHDFHGMLFTPYLSQDIIPLIKECWLIANGQTIIKCQFQGAFWARAQVDWKVYDRKVTLLMPCDSNPEGNKVPIPLWHINLHKPQ